MTRARAGAAAVALILATAASAPPRTAASAATAPSTAECSNFTAVFYSEIAPLSGHQAAAGAIITAAGDLAAALPDPDGASRTVRDAAVAVQRDAQTGDTTDFGRDAVQLLSLCETLLAVCGPGAPAREA